ncbi:phage holin family protein [Albidovulum sp.]|uniref:phage holin family protein n=1 Tax=Albidovulum sp. TaxID=1872424 RepID=UPI0039B97715
MIGLVGLQALAGAAVAGLVAAGLGPVWSPLIIGLALCAIAAAFAYAGRAALAAKGIAPRRSLRNLRRDAVALKAAVTKAAVTAEGVRHV